MIKKQQINLHFAKHNKTFVNLKTPMFKIISVQKQQVQNIQHTQHQRRNYLKLI